MRTAESVSPGHPDKICDIISDSILDAILEQDKDAKVAVETMGGHGEIKVTGEITSNAEINYKTIIKKDALLDFGCEFGFFSAYLSKEFKKIYLVEIYDELLNNGLKIHDRFGNNNYSGIINRKEDSSYFIDKIEDKINLFLFFDVLEHVVNLDNFIKRLKDISSENSYLLISLPTENFFYMLLTKFKKEPDHCNRYFEIEKKLKSLNCKLIEKKTILFLFNIYLFKL